MKNQVTTIEQSRRLMEFGVPAEKASMVWTQCSNNWHLAVLPHYTAQKKCIESGRSIAAFTVADLLEMMPKCINGDYSFALYVQGRGWGIEWVDGDMCVGQMCHEHIHVLLCDRIEWLLSNGYKLEL